jgi:glycosyltransferase involved in cell wall biosynthesis
VTTTVLLVNDVASVGGGQTVMLDVARVLIAAGFTAHVACPPGHLADQATAIGADWHEFHFAERRLLTPRGRLPRLRAVAARVDEGRRLAALAAEVGADIVHTGALVPHLDVVATGRRPTVRTVWHLNQVHPAYLFAGPLPDTILSVSRAALRPARWRAAARARAAVVPNGIDVDRFRPPAPDERLQIRERLGLGEEFTVVTVARLEPLKGVDTLIRAAAAARSRPAVLVVGDATGYVGGPAYADGLRTLADDLGVDARFLGNRADVPELLRAADAFAYASRYDAAPLVLAEASATGLPVVTGNAGGCGEMIHDGVTGVLLEPEDVTGFATTFDRLAGSPDLRLRLGRAGRQRAVEELDLGCLADRLLPHYVDLVGVS